MDLRGGQIVSAGREDAERPLGRDATIRISSHALYRRPCGEFVCPARRVRKSFHESQLRALGSRVDPVKNEVGDGDLR